MKGDILRREGGQVTPMIVIFVTALLLFAGLTFDGGRLLAARREARAIASNAARAGAQVVDIGALRSSGDHRLDAAGAHTAALDYLAQVGHTGEVNVGSDTVTVTVRITTDMALLGLAGLGPREVTGTGSARTLRSVTG